MKAIGNIGGVAVYRGGRRARGNDTSAYVPEMWANESLAILEESMVGAGLCNRDFQPELANFGDTVNTRRPAEFLAKRKTDDDDVTVQAVSAANVQVVMNQWIHVSFVIKDGERNKAFKDLVNIYLRPAMLANARLLDQSVLGQAVQFLDNTRGGLGQLSKTTMQDYLVDTGALMTMNKAYEQDRNLVLAPLSHAHALKTDIFTSAERVGDSGTALREASLGKKLGFNTFQSLNVPNSYRAPKEAATTTTAAALPGATSVAITAAQGVGEYVTIAGEYRPQRSTTATTTFTPTRPFVNGCASGAAVQAYTAGAVDLVAGYANGYVGLIHVDGLANGPHVGQLVAFNNGDTATGTIRTPEYVITQAINTAGNDWDILLDRPLETALADGDAVCYGPDGDMNFAFHKNALTLVNRPLDVPLPGTGARAAYTVYNNMSMRATICYEGRSQGHLITLDGLFGVKVLDTNLGAVLLG